MPNKTNKSTTTAAASQPQTKPEPVETPTTDVITAGVKPGELISAQSQSQAIAFVQTPENIELLKKSLADSKTILTDSELGIFLYQAQKTGLDPLARQIYVMKRDQGGVSFMTSIDGQRLVAQRTHEYDGQAPPQWCGPDGVWKEVWLSKENPAAARVGVYRKGMREPVYGIATWNSYARYTDVWENGRKTGARKPMGVWGQMGDVMIAKCAEALALRKAFPQELSGLYTPEEMNATEDAPEPPRVMTTQQALADAGKTLVEKGFSRNEAITIMMGIADVDDPTKLTGQNLSHVRDVVEEEDAGELALFLPGNPDDQPPRDDPPEAETVIDPPEEKTVAQAMADGDENPPASFLKPDEVVPVTDEAVAGLQTPPESTKPRYEVPDWKFGATKLPRPEMRELYKKLIALYAPAAKDAKAFNQETIGKDAPALADDFIAVCNHLADLLNEMAEQGKLGV